MAPNHVPAGAIAGNDTPFREAMMGLVSGMAFGFVSPIVGHPFDTLKTNMQVKEVYRGKGMLHVGRDIVRLGGLRSLYSGLLPPLVGSTAFRGVQFSAYSAAFSFAESTEFGKVRGGVEKHYEYSFV